MKKTAILFGTLLVSILIRGQAQSNSVGIGTANPNPNAVLDLVSPTQDQGLLVPRLTTAQRTAPALVSKLSVADDGLLIFDSDEGAFYYWMSPQWLSLQDAVQFSAGNGISITGNVISASDDDPINEIQDLQLSGTILSITDNLSATGIDLSGFSGADAQQLTLTGNILGIENGNTVDLSGFLDNTDNQDLNLTANMLALSGSSTTIDLTPYLDNTDAQELNLTSNTLSISGGAATVDLSPYLDNTDAQDLNLTANMLALSGSSTTIDLAPYLDNTDAQELNLTSNTLSISGGTASVDLLSYLDNTDAQDLSLTGNILSLTNSATPVDLAPYLDNTDAQELTLTSNTLSISGGTSSVDLSPYLDNTDVQDLSLAGTTLSLSGDPTSVNLPSLITSTGTQNRLAKWNNAGGTTIGNSSITDNGTVVTVSSPLNLTNALQANGDAGVGLGYALTSNGPGNPPSWTFLSILSDVRLKEDIVDLDYGLSDLLKLRPVSYRMKQDPQHVRLGLIAQEVREVVPEVVEENNVTGYLGVGYMQLVPVLINAVKEMQMVIVQQKSHYEELQSRMDSQEKRLRKLESMLGLEASDMTGNQ